MNLLWEEGRVSLSPHRHTRPRLNMYTGKYSPWRPRTKEKHPTPSHPWLIEGWEHGRSLSVPLPCVFEQVTRPVGALASYPSNEGLIPQTCRKLWFSHAMVLASSWTLVRAAGYWRRLKSDEEDRREVRTKDSVQNTLPQRPVPNAGPVNMAATLVTAPSPSYGVQRDSGISDAGVAG